MFWKHLFFVVEELYFGYRMLNKGYKIFRSCAMLVFIMKRLRPEFRESGFSTVQGAGFW
jgi:hypothetical protein